MPRRFLAVFVFVMILATGAFHATTATAADGTLALRPYMHFDGPRAIPRKAAAPIVGTQIQFWVWDLSVMPPADKQIYATCRGVSDNGYVFVEDDQWNVAMDQSDVDAILNAWDTETPAGSVDTSKGIYDIETDLFGATPDVDGWPGIVLLYYNMGCFQGTCFDGFYRYDDQLAGSHSNQMDMLHMEATQNDPGGEYMLGVEAHEFNHMLQMVHDTSEEPWLSEALAEAAMIVTGYDTDLDWLDDFVHHPTTSFWGDEFSVHYGAALLMGTYIYEFGGTDLLQAVVNDNAHGADSMEEQLSDLDLGTFPSFFGDMATAVAADHFVDTKATDSDGRFHYDLLSVDELIVSGVPPCAAEAGELDCEWSPSVGGGTLTEMTVDELPDASFTLSIDRADVGVLEVALVSVTADGDVVVTRIGANEDWADVSVDPANLVAYMIVLANPTSGSSDAVVTLTTGSADDDTDDDTADDDSGDDDAADDDASGDDDDDDDDSGCGC